MSTSPGYIQDDHVDLYALLSAERAVDGVAAVARVALSLQNPSIHCPTYLEALNWALREEPPPFGTALYEDMYRGASANGQWIVISLITNAQQAVESARRLWSLAACSADVEVQQLLERHAVDRSRHALAFLALLDLSFPDALMPAFRAELDKLFPDYSTSQRPLPLDGSPHARVPSAPDFLQLNLAWIRTVIHHVMQRSALAAHCPAENLPRARATLDSLLRDDLVRVADTAALIERHVGDAAPDALRALFCRCLRDFSESTCEEPIDFSYHLRFGNYP